MVGINIERNDFMLLAKSNLIKDVDGKVYKLDRLYLGEKVEATPEDMAKYDLSPCSGYLKLDDGNAISEVDLIYAAASGGNVDLSDYLTKIETIELLNEKANSDEVYTITEVEDLLISLREEILSSIPEGFETDWGTLEEGLKKIEVQLLRGTDEQISSYKGKVGQVVVNTDTHQLHIMDGVKLGGHVSIGGSGGDIGDTSGFLSKIGDKATYEEVSQGDLDSKYLTPKKIHDYLHNLLLGSGINVFTVNGKHGSVIIGREDLELENVINVKQASEVDFLNHTSDYNEAHISWSEKRNIYNKIAEATNTNLDALPRSSKATIEDAIEGVDDELYLTSRSFYELLKRQFGEPQDLSQVMVTSVNGKVGDIIFTREDVELENVLNATQATKEEFDRHLEEVDNYHVTKAWRDMIIGRIILLEQSITKALSKDMKASTDLALEGVDDATYMTPKLIKSLVEKTFTEGGVSSSSVIGNLEIGDTYISPDMFYNDAPIEWIVVDKNRYNKGEVTLLAKNILSIKPFDGAEKTNPNANRRGYGNNDYAKSNIHQWLNASGEDWYTPQHQYDGEPGTSNILNGVNSYNLEYGFLTNFYDSAKKYIVDVTNKFKPHGDDGENYIEFTSKVFLPSMSELGLNEDIEEGLKFRLLRGGEYDLTANPTRECVQQCEYTESSLNPLSSYTYWTRTISENGLNSDVSCINPKGVKIFSGARNTKVGIRPVINVMSNMPIEKNNVNKIKEDI